MTDSGQSVAEGAILRNRHTGEETRVREVERDEHGHAVRISLDRDKPGSAFAVGWAPEAITEHWEHVR